MADLRNTAEGGTDTVAVTAGTSGGASGNAFSQVNSGSGGAITWRAAGAYRGNLCYDFSQPTAGNVCIVDLTDAGASADWSIRVYVFIVSLPTAGDQPFPLSIRSTSALLGSVSMNAAGQVRVSAGTSTAAVTSAYSTAALNTGVWYRVEYFGTGFGTSAAASTVRVFAGDATGSPILSQSVSGVNSAAQAQTARFGKPAGGSVVAFRLDDLAATFGAGTPLGPSVDLSADAGPDQFNVAPGQIVTLTGTGPGSWTQTSGPTVTLTGSGATRIFAAPTLSTASTLTFAYGSDTMTVTVEAADLGGMQTNTAEGGTNGAVVTAANSGAASGTAFSTVAAGTGGTITFSTAAAYRGNLGYAFSQPAAGVACVVDIDGPAAAPSFTVRVYLRLLAFPSAPDLQFPVSWRTLTGAIGRLEMDTTGRIRINTGAASPYTSVGMGLGTWYRVEVQGSGYGSPGSVTTATVSVGDATTALTSVTYTSTTTALVQRIRYGKLGMIATVAWQMDNIAQLIGTPAQIGPSEPGPTGNAGTDQVGVEPWSTVTLTATGTGTWTQTSGPTVTLTGSGATRAFAAPATLSGATLTFAYGGDEMTVTVLPVTERAVVGGFEVPMLLRLALA